MATARNGATKSGTRGGGKAPARRCRDCTAEGITTYRKILRAGRCATHDRAWRTAKSRERKAKHVSDFAGITEDEYQALLKAQGGSCYICRRKPGRIRLAIDHDHEYAKQHCSHDPVNKACRNCIRGLLDKTCNRYLGRLHDDADAFKRGADYLINPPARVVFGPRS